MGRCGNGVLPLSSAESKGARVCMRCGPRERCAGREAGARGVSGWSGGGGSGMHGGKAQLKRLGGQGTRGAHVEHLVHARDAGRVKTQRLVERLRVLPSRREGIRCGARGRPV